MKIKDLLEKRAQVVAEARAIVDGIESEEKEREFTAEERSKYDALLEKAGQLTDQIQDEERKQELARQEAAIDAGGTGASGDDGNRASGDPPETRDQAVLQIDGFRSWISHGMEEAERRDPDAFSEFRAQSVGVDTEGGYLVAPQEFVNELIRNIDDMTYIRSWATVRRLTMATSLGVPTLESSLDDYAWTTEIASAAEDEGLRIGKRELHPQPLAKLVKISNRLLRLSAQDVDELVRSEMALILGYTYEKAFLIGSGANQPLGVFTASSDGIPTSRDVATDNTAVAVTTDGLIEAKFALKAGHRRNARWLFHRDAIKMIAKLKDADSQYIWSGAVREGEPDRLLGLPYFESEFAPNTFTTGLYVGILGDFSYYWIAEEASLQIQRLSELFARTDQTGLIARPYIDAMPVLAEAFVRVKLS